VLIVAAVVAAVAAPLLRPGADAEPAARAERLTELEARKEAKYREIRDAQSDLSAGKLSAADHQALDRSLRREAIEILDEIDRVSNGRDG
jgi:hypothetical protein